MAETVVSLQAFLSYPPPAPKFPLPLLTPATEAITDQTFITLGSKCYYRWDLYNYYAWVQMLLQMGPLLHLVPVITDGTFITLGSKCYYRWDLYYTWVQMLLQMGPLLHSGLVITLVSSTPCLLLLSYSTNIKSCP